MIIINLKGGLGNQMFQYAVGKIIARTKKTHLLLDNSFFNLQQKSAGFTPRKFELTIFPNSYNVAQGADLDYFFHLSLLNKLKKKFRLRYPKVYNSPTIGFDNSIFFVSQPVYLNGYFQSYRYYAGHEEYIRRLFTFPLEKLDSHNKELISKIETITSVAVHIRRGDYVKDKKTQDFHGNCSKEYYLEAIHYLNSKFQNIHLFFFSDDNDWVKNEFHNLPFAKTFIGHNFSENSWKDMCLMSECKHNIIANSSFSWWGAWLNRNPEKKVIAPKNWFAKSEKEMNISDLIPPEWIRI